MTGYEVPALRFSLPVFFMVTVMILMQSIKRYLFFQWPTFSVRDPSCGDAWFYFVTLEYTLWIPAFAGMTKQKIR